MFDWLFPWRTIARQLDRIEYQQALIEDHINEGNNRIMADLTGLTAAVDQMSTDVSEAVTELQRLGAIIRDGGNITQAELDALADKLASSGTALDDAVAEDETPA